VCALFIFAHFVIVIIRHAQSLFCWNGRVYTLNANFLDELPRLGVLQCSINALIFSGIFFDFGLNESLELREPEDVNHVVCERDPVTVIQNT
jgi:hypothetical protein